MLVHFLVKVTIKLWTGHIYLWSLLHIGIYNTKPRTKYWKVFPAQVLKFFLSPPPSPATVLLSSPFLVDWGWCCFILVKLLRTSWPCGFSAGSYFSLLVWLGGGGCLVKECESSLEFIVRCSRGKWNYRSQGAWGGRGERQLLDQCWHQ